MAPRPCLICGRPCKGPRCLQHERDHQRARNKARPHYQGEWQALAKRTVEAHIQRFGHVCPGWGVPAHPSHDLCCDHVTARDASHLQVLCRSCNSRKSVSERT